MLRDSALAKELGHQGQARLAAHFDWPVEARRVEALYEVMGRREKGA
ncbi:MAG: hypothetical protein ACRDIB_11660 [Ardenticatenaceae bacterium]